jgi:hypothetical protein
MLSTMQRRVHASQDSQVDEQITQTGLHWDGDLPDEAWWFTGHLDGTLYKYLEQIRPSLSAAVWLAFQQSDLQLKRRVLAEI